MVTNDKKFIKTFGSPYKNNDKKEKEKKARMAIAKLFALHANAKKIILSFWLGKYNKGWKTKNNV